MLRLSIIDEPFSTTLKAEGKLIGQWVSEARKVWLDVSRQATGRKKLVDLFDVTFVDDSGRALLVEMHDGGARLVGSGPMISALIEEIEAPAPKPARKTLQKVWVFVLGLLLLIAFGARSSLGQTIGTVLTLDDAIATARAHNRQLKAKRLDIDIAADQVAITKTNRLPKLSTDIYGSGLLTDFSFEFAKGAFGNFPGTGPIPDKNTKVTAERSFNLIATGQLKQPLSQLYRINLGVRAQELMRGVAAEQARNTEQDLIRDVRRAYFAILQTRSAQNSNAASVASLKELHRVLKDRLEQRTALPADELEVRVALSKAQQTQLVLDNQFASEREQLNLLMGREPAAEFELADVTDSNWQDDDLDGAKARALAQRPELRESELRAKAADYDRRIKKAERLPDVGMFVSYFSPFNVDVVPKNISAGGIQLTWEPFDWGRKKKELHQKEVALQQANLAVQQTRDSVQAEVARAHRSLKEANAQAEVARLNLEAVKERLRVVTNQFEQKAALLKDVLDLQSKLAEAQHQQHDSLLAYWNAKADFAKAAGEE